MESTESTKPTNLIVDSKRMLLFRSLCGSVHLIAPYPPLEGKNCCGFYIGCGDGKAKDAFRVEELKHFLMDKYYDSNMPTMVIGDMNCMDGPCHEYLKDAKSLQSSWSDDRKQHRYWLCCRHSPYSWRGMLCSICCCAPKLFDHIYFSKHFQLVESDVLQIGESDHYPVYATLEATI